MSNPFAILNQVAPIRLSIALLAIVSLGYMGDARAQTKSPDTVAQPTIAPSRLFEQLTRPDPTSQFGQQRIAALKALGIEESEVEGLRLTFEDLDGDGIAEALFTVDIDLANVRLVVLKRKGDQWYRLASPPGFSCWCKYEYSPLDTFAEIRDWASGGGNDEPAKLLFVRGSSGGTGLYDRGLNLYSLRGFELNEVFGASEERRECGGPVNKCDLYHVEVTPVHEPDEPAALVAASYVRHLPGDDFYRDTWWIGLPVHQCKAYTWSTQRQKFTENPVATTAYCSHLGKQPPPSHNR
jgi:hypothetical protein